MEGVVFHPVNPPRRIAIGTHPDIQGILPAVEEVRTFLQKYDIPPVVSQPLDQKDFRQQIKDGAFDLLIAMGGDGTMLRAGRLCAPAGIPVLGINLGHFGFLMEIDDQNWSQCLPRIMDGKFFLEERMMLHAEHWRENEKLAEWEALNEVVISRGSLVRPIRLISEVDGYALTNYVADALIVATATGSTAYALAVQGPILSPELRNLIVAPVAPHLSVDRSIVLSDRSEVKITVYTHHEAVISADGRKPNPLEDGDVVLVKSSEYNALFVRMQDPGYFYRNLTRYLEHNPTVTD